MKHRWFVAGIAALSVVGFGCGGGSGGGGGGYPPPAQVDSLVQVRSAVATARQVGARRQIIMRAIMGRQRTSPSRVNQAPRRATAQPLRRRLPHSHAARYHARSIVHGAAPIAGRFARRQDDNGGTDEVQFEGSDSSGGVEFTATDNQSDHGDMVDFDVFNPNAGNEFLGSEQIEFTGAGGAFTLSGTGEITTGEWAGFRETLTGTLSPDGDFDVRGTDVFADGTTITFRCRESRGRMYEDESIYRDGWGEPLLLRTLEDLPAGVVHFNFRDSFREIDLIMEANGAGRGDLVEDGDRNPIEWNAIGDGLVRFRTGARSFSVRR